MTTLESRRAQWQSWRDERDALATARYGPAALTGTHWLDDRPAPIDGIPGTWIASEGRAVGTGPGLRIDLASDEEHRHGDLLLRAIIRADRVALRVFDPAAPTRVGLLGIDAFDPDPDWVVPGTLEITSGTVQLEHIDGFVSDNPGAVVRVPVNGTEIALQGAATPDGGAQLVFADSTNGAETQRFRFLTVAAPDANGRVEVDFNRAHLPPCTFSDHFLCPLPPAGNRLGFPVRAGETRLRREEAAR